MARTKQSMRKNKTQPTKKLAPAISGIKKPRILKISLKQKLSSITKELKEIKKTLLLLLDGKK